jgi:CheY-like chemotaxis protein
MTGEQRVLVVEDDDALRDLLVALLTDEGFAVRGAAHGVEALEVLRDWACHVIVLDLEMPVMNGQDLLARLRSRAAWGAIPVIVTTSNHRATQRALSLGASAVLLKPFDIQALTDLVGRLTEHRAHHAGDGTAGA